MKVRSASLTNVIERTLFLAGEALGAEGRPRQLGPGRAGGGAPGQQAAPRATITAPEPEEPVIGQGGAGGTCRRSTERAGWTQLHPSGPPGRLSQPESHPRARSYRTRVELQKRERIAGGEPVTDEP